MRVFLPLLTLLLPAVLVVCSPVSNGIENKVVQTFEADHHLATRAGPPDVLSIFEQLHAFDDDVADTFASLYHNWKTLSRRLDRALADGTENMSVEEFASVRKLMLETEEAKMSLQATIDKMYGFLPHHLRPKIPGA